jgi:hypothetical protein
MATDSDPAGRTSATREDGATFDLERFSWEGPGCLGVSGTFAGLGETADEVPVLVVRSADRELRLPAVADTLSGPPEDGRPWQASFAWQEPPIAFDAATLALGEDLMIDLPDPGTSRPRFRHRMLAVRRAVSPVQEDPAGDEQAAEQPPDTTEPSPAPLTGAATSPTADIERLRLEANLLAVEEQARDASAAVERANEELARARADLEAERERHAVDAQRFQDSLARVSGSIEEAVATERGAAAQLQQDLEEARRHLAERDAAMEALRRELDAATTARSESEAHAGSLRERIDELEQAGAEVVELRAEVERKRGQTAAALDALAVARTATEETRADAERLLNRLKTIVEALGQRE